MSVCRENTLGINVGTSQSRDACEEAGVGVWTMLAGGWTRPGAVG